MKRLLCAAAVLAASCVNQTDYYAPPVQRKSLYGPDTSHLKNWIAMNDPHAQAHLVRGIRDLDSNLFRWMGKEGRLHFVLPQTHGLRFVLDFTLHEITFDATGPLTLSIAINGKPLDSLRLDKVGQRQYEKPVDPSLLLKGDNVVSLDLDKVFVAEDKVEIGLILYSAGFLD